MRLVHFCDGSGTGSDWLTWNNGRFFSRIDFDMWLKLSGCEVQSGLFLTGAQQLQVCHEFLYYNATVLHFVTNLCSYYYVSLSPKEVMFSLFSVCLCVNNTEINWLDFRTDLYMGICIVYVQGGAIKTVHFMRSHIFAANTDINIWFLLLYTDSIWDH